MLTESSAETKRAAAKLAKELKKSVPAKTARVVALEGKLGTGKTTFVQGFAKALGIKERVLSPTFVLVKIYQFKHRRLKHLVHIDCYRLRFPKNLLHLGFRDLLKDQDAIVIVEWADRIKKLIPRSALWIKFQHGENPTERIIKIKI